MCSGGPNHKHNLSCNLFTSELTRAEVVDLLAKQGYTADVEEDSGTGRVRITTKEPLPSTIKILVEISMPPGVLVNFAVEDRTRLPIPKSLAKWARETQKELKKL